MSALMPIGRPVSNTQVYVLDAALDNMAQGLAMFDVNQRLIICNQRFLDLYNLPATMAQPGTELAESCPVISSSVCPRRFLWSFRPSISA